MPISRIKDISVIECEPQGVRPTDEKEAAKAPFTASPLNGGWGEIRLRDGTVIEQ